MTFGDVLVKYSFCLGGGCDKGALKKHICNSGDVDALLSPEMDSIEVKMSLLEDDQARKYQVALFHALADINNSEGGWRAPCGCWFIWQPIRHLGHPDPSKIGELLDA